MDWGRKSLFLKLGFTRCNAARREDTRKKGTKRLKHTENLKGRTNPFSVDYPTIPSSS